VDQRCQELGSTMPHMSTQQVSTNKTPGITPTTPITRKSMERFIYGFYTAFTSLSLSLCHMDHLQSSHKVCSLCGPTHTFQCPTTRQVILSRDCCLHGLPKTFVSNRDPLFVNTFWKHLFKAQGTTIKFISFYHPWSNRSP